MSYQALVDTVNMVYPQDEIAGNEFKELFTPRRLKKGEYFVKIGKRTSEAAFILSGVMRTFYLTSDGVEYNKTFFVENTFAISYAAVLQRSESYLAFQALTDCDILVADYYKIEELFKRHRCVETFIRVIIQNEWVIKKEQRELRLVLNSAEERYLYFKQEYPGLENRIPQYHIASHLGITPIQLSRIRAKMANRNK